MPSRFPEPDLDRLEHYLNAPERIESALPLDSVQGLFAAVASGPAPVHPDIWMPEVLGADHAFANAEEAADITDLLVRFHDETARQLNEGEGFDFILYGPEGAEEDLSGWAEGYLIGVDLAEPPWESTAEYEDLDNMLFPFLALTGQAKELALEQGEEWMSEDEEARMLSDIRADLANHLMEVRHYWFEKRVPDTVRREGPKIGRNDPCPCGSGKKYKNCHGT
jgi:uncharacterized protein